MLASFEPKCCVLFIGPRADEDASLRRIFDGSSWQFHTASTSRDGVDLLRRHQDAFGVVICQESLPDGDWRRLLADLERMRGRASLIVASRLADERLWAEVLNMGAFDVVLGPPFDPDEILRVTESAWRASTMNCRSDRIPSARPKAPEAALDTRSPTQSAGVGVAAVR